MIAALIRWSIGNRFLVLLATLFLIAAGLWSVAKTPLDALPDLSDTQVIVRTPFPGKAPQIVEEVFNIVKDLNDKEKVTFLIAEQNTNMALKYADYGYIMESGRVVMDGEAEYLRTNEDVKEFYLGVGGGERKSFKDVKSYKRRKRWLA